MPHIQVYLWILSGLIILSASVLKGLTGFGFALIALPVLSLIFPMTVLVPAMSIFNMFTSLLIVLQLKERIRWHYFVPMFAASLLGIPLGIYFLEYINEFTLKIVTGLVVIIFSAKMLGKINLAKRFKDMPIVFAGFLSGILNTSISVGGPPIVIAMTRKGYGKNLFRGALAWFSMFSALFTTAAYFAKHLVPHESLTLAISCVPLLLLGSRWGNRWALKIHQEKFRRVVVVMNIITGIIIVTATLIKGKHGQP